MSTVKDVLAGKTTAQVYTIAETASVLDAVTAMNQYRMGPNPTLVSPRAK
jgi:hypothetical protein